MRAAHIHDADANDREGERRAEADEVTQHAERQQRRRNRNQNAEHNRAHGRRFEGLVDLGEEARDQTVARHLIEHARLCVDQHQHHRGEAGERADLDQQREDVERSRFAVGPWDHSPFRVHAVDGDGDRRRHAEFAERHHARHHHGDGHVDQGADNQRTEDADRQVLLRIARFASRRRNRFEADISEEHDRGRPQHALRTEMRTAFIRRHEGVPVCWVHVGHANSDEGQQHDDFDRDDDVVDGC